MNCHDVRFTYTRTNFPHFHLPQNAVTPNHAITAPAAAVNPIVYRENPKQGMGRGTQEVNDNE